MKLSAIFRLAACFFGCCGLIGVGLMAYQFKLLLVNQVSSNFCWYVNLAFILVAPYLGAYLFSCSARFRKEGR